MDFVHATVVEIGRELRKKRLANVPRSLELRRVGTAGPYLFVGPVPEVEVRLGLAANQVGLDLLALLAQQLNEGFSLLQHTRRIGSGKPAVGGHDQHGGTADLLRLGGQGVIDLRLRCDCGNGAGDRVGIRQRRRYACACLANARGSDQLHRLEDLAHRRGRGDLLAVDPDLGSHTCPFLRNPAREYGLGLMPGPQTGHRSR